MLRSEPVSSEIDRLLVAPAVPARIQRRERLSLSNGASTITEIWASAGAGKTTLLATWAEELRLAGEKVAWIAVPARPLPRAGLPWLIQASCKRAGWAGGTPSELPPAVDFDLGEITEPFTIVIDDLHHLLDRADAEWLIEMCRQKSPHLRLILSGRYPPPVLARLPWDREVRELRSNALAFTSEEAAAFFRSRNIHLRTSELCTVQERTQGWIAALVLLAGWLQRSGKDASLPAGFGGDHRAIADYLVNEVLSQLPAGYRDFLLITSAVDFLTVPLAVHLTGRSDAGTVLEELEKYTALLSHVTELEDVYVYHATLLSYLRAESRRRDLRAYKAAQRAAAQWYCEHQHADVGLELLLRTEVADDILDYLNREGMALVFSGYSSLVKRALELINDHGLGSTTTHLLDTVITAPHLPDTVRADFHLGAVHNSIGTSADELRLVYAALVVLRTDSPALRAALDDLDAVEVSVRAGDPSFDGGTLDALVFCALARAVAVRRLGEPEVALALLRAALASVQRSTRRWLYLNLIDLASEVATGMEGWAEALAYRDLVLTDVHADSRPSDLVSARVQLAMATAGFEKGADRTLSRVEAILLTAGEHLDLGLKIPAAALRILMLLDSGISEREHLDELHRLLRVYGKRYPLTLAMCAYTYVSLTLRFHDKYRSLESRDFIVGILGENSLEAHLASALYGGSGGRRANVESHLESVLESAPHTWNHTSPVLGWLLLAKWADESGRSTIADVRLIRALALAEPMQTRQPFLADAGLGAQLVEARLGRLGSYDDFGRSVVDIANRRTSLPQPVSSVAFTQKEREILRELPRHQSISEIAEKQWLSSNTVKTHLRSIYQKFGVSGRTAAVERAMNEGLL